MLQSLSPEVIDHLSSHTSTARGLEPQLPLAEDYFFMENGDQPFAPHAAEF